MANRYVILDTNVLIAANGNAPQVMPEGVLKCQEFVGSLRENAVISIDSLNEIFDEYFNNNLNRSGKPGIGDAFAKYLWDNQQNPDICEIVNLEHDKEFVFTVFKDKKKLLQFDKSDLKFIAVHLKSKFKSPIYNACDSDWQENNELLEEYSITVIELLNRDKARNIWS